MLEDLLNRQKQYINYYFDHLDKEEMNRFIQMCLNTEGLIVFTGVGKSGIIADKIAMTLVSTGTKALSLPPTNFLHGDIGILSEKDLLVLISRSGETEELFNLISFARKRGTPLAAIISNPQSRLSRMCDISVHLPLEKELCPFDLAPTTSTALQLLCGDLLAVALMQAKRFDLSQYVLNHPSGSIGQKIKSTLTVENVMQKEIPLAMPDQCLGDVLPEFSNKKMGALVIADAEKNLLGVFTDGDLRRALQAYGSDVLAQPMHHLMSHAPLSISKEMLAWDALKFMQRDPKKFVMILPVVDGQKVIGMLRMHDIVQAGVA
jgi:arabinose-5-phosphate isomerase